MIDLNAHDRIGNVLVFVAKPLLQKQCNYAHLLPKHDLCIGDHELVLIFLVLERKQKSKYRKLARVVLTIKSQWS